jgi:hypothetical protein
MRKLGIIISLAVLIAIGSGFQWLSVVGSKPPVAGGGGTITPAINGYAATFTSNSTVTVTPSPSPATGSTSIIYLYTSSSITALSGVDNLSNALSVGPAVSPLASLYQASVPSGVTSYILSWTTARTGFVVEEGYSGVTAVVGSGSVNNGSSTTADIAVATSYSNDYIVCGLGDGATHVMTVTVGTPRQAVTTTANNGVLVDNTSASPATIDCTATQTTGVWKAAAIELKP